ncbi:MAG: hypothetical protein J4F41_00135 [Alphaproteobacteria bacterium]|nr:hypothetical protein [Alphaproteobacteria bacterium]
MRYFTAHNLKWVVGLDDWSHLSDIDGIFEEVIDRTAALNPDVAHNLHQKLRANGDDLYEFLYTASKDNALRAILDEIESAAWNIEEQRWANLEGHGGTCSLRAAGN